MPDALDVPCPRALRRQIDVVCGAWRLEVLLACASGPKRFGELALLDELDGVSPKMLATALRELRTHGLLERGTHPTASYTLSEAGEAYVARLAAIVP